MAVVQIDTAILKMALRSIRVAAISIVQSIDAVLEVLEPEEGPTPVRATAPQETDPCKRGEHPAEYVRDARVFGEPNRRVCRRCKVTFTVVPPEEQPNGNEAVSE
jgi:hypothetical protein